MEKENVYLRVELRAEHNFEEIVGNSPALLKALHAVDQVAPTDSTVLIYGETGTGKELVARAIHSRSARNGRALVNLNCSAISAGLVESELFGHMKGAFTGALERRIGRFELAHGGTIFLDEIGELSLETQVKLLRVLQEHEFEPVGSSRSLRVDVRVIAATNRDLMLLVASTKRMEAPETDAPEHRQADLESPKLLLTLDEVDRNHILAALQHTSGVVDGPKGAARILNLHPNTLRHRMDKLGIKGSRHRPS